MTKSKTDRRWRVVYNLAYDGGGSGEWNGYYRTLMGARIAKWWNVHISSWGGTALLIDQDRYRAPIFRIDP
jgi:hypothetical protein